MEKVTIGVVAKRLVVQGKIENVVHESINRAILDYGGRVRVIMPVSSRRLPMCDDAEAAVRAAFPPEEAAGLLSQLADCDGVLIQGGNYADFYEGLVALYCYEHDLPILGICNGCQIMTRVLGGSLVRVGDTATHVSEADRAHDLRIDPASRLAKLLGATTTWTNSRHGHQIEQTGALTPVAWAPDGVVEALEAPNKQFYLAIQSHPEDIYVENPEIGRVFQGLLAAARSHRATRTGQKEVV